MIPKLGKQLNRRYDGNYITGYSEQGCRQQENRKYFYDRRNALSQCAGKVKFFAAVVYNMIVPEKIVMM